MKKEIICIICPLGCSLTVEYAQKVIQGIEGNQCKLGLEYAEKEIFNPVGFHVDRIHFYHYHALPPIFEKKNPELFRELSLKMEKPDDWRGYFMASAFVVEAKLE